MNDDIIYYIHINGQQAGPFPKEKLIEVGMTPDSMVWRSDMPNWVEARTLPELMDLMNPPQPRPFSAQPPYVSNPQYNSGGYPPQAPYQPPYNGGYGPNNGYNPGPRYPGTYPPGWKNWLAWAIIGTVITAIPSYGIGFITGIIAIIFSALANSEAKRGEWDSAQSKNTVAKVLTIITLILALLIVLGIILAFIFAFSFLSFLGAAY